MNIALILNWKAPFETIQCIESVINNCRTINTILVVDNASPDDSLSIFEQWKAANSGVSKNVIFIQNIENSGFAGGNNFGIKWALNNLVGCKNFWILNNDTLLKDDAFLPLLREISRSPYNFYGSTIVNAATRQIECWGGGRIYPCIGKAKLLGRGMPLSTPPPKNLKISYLMGCSLAFSEILVSRSGLMDESYFMYSEEADWQWRAKKQGIGIRHVSTSVVHHIGSMSSGGKSDFYYFYRNRAAIMFNKRFFGFPVAAISALNLSIITFFQEFRNPSRWISGARGAFAGLTTGFK